MIRTHQITGVGPVAADGSVQLFTILPTPFTVSAEWLTAASRMPAVGDDLVDNGETLALAVTDAEQVALDAKAAEQAAPDDAQKKTDGLSASGSGLEASPPVEPPPVNEAQPTAPPENKNHHQRLEYIEQFLSELAADMGKVF